MIGTGIQKEIDAVMDWQKEYDSIIIVHRPKRVQKIINKFKIRKTKR